MAPNTAASPRHAHFEVEDPPLKHAAAASQRETDAGGPAGYHRRRASGSCPCLSWAGVKQALVSAYWWGFAWADPHLKSLRSLKITIRCAIALEACYILMLSSPSRQITSTSKVFEGSYLIPLMAFFLPPSDSMSVYIEKTLMAALMMSTAWAYDCFVIWISWLARSPDKRFHDQRAFENYLQSHGFASMGDAQNHIYADLPFLDDWSAAVTIVFLAFGLGILVWFRGQVLAGTAHVVSTIAVILQLALPLTTSIYFPFPYYMLGLPPFAAFGFASVFNLVVAFLIFPESSNHRFLDQLGDTIAPLRRIISTQSQLLTTPPSAENWAPFATLNEDYWKITNTLQAMEKTKILLKTEISFRRLGPQDTSQLLLHARKASTAASGLLRFQLLVSKHLSVPIESSTPTLDDFTLHIAPSQPASRMATPPTSPHRSRVSSTVAQHSGDVPIINSPEHSNNMQQDDPDKSFGGKSRRSASGSGHKRNSSAGTISPFAHQQIGNNTSFLSTFIANSNTRRPVGVYMSSRYAQLENLLSRPDDAEIIQLMVDYLHEQCRDLIQAMDDGFEHVTLALQLLKSSSPIKAFQGRARITNDVVEQARKAQVKLESELERFLAKRGHSFDSSKWCTKPTIRSLFWSLLYQYSVQKTAEQVIDLLDTVRRYETENKRTQLYYPSLSILVKTSRLDTDAFEDDPDFIAGLGASKTMRSTPRDPDRLPPESLFQLVGHYLYLWLSYLGRPSAFFLYKTTLLEALLLCPIAVPSVSARYYRYRAVWAPILSSMTMSQHLGETLHGFVYRLLGSLGGALFGYIVWEISSKNQYGSAVIAMFAFIGGAFFRVFHPEPALVIIGLTTFSIVLGYSWQNYLHPGVLQVSYGFKLAAARFVMSAAGLAATFIWAFLPPAPTQKISIRKTYARTLTEIGFVLCDTLTHANTIQSGANSPDFLFKNLTAIRAKLHMTLRRRSFISYEIPVRGRWPKEQWLALAENQLELVDWIEQLLEVLNGMSTPYRKAFLQRSKLNSPRFLGRIMSSMHAMSMSLQLGLPIPAMYTPLLEDMDLETGFETDDGHDLPDHLSASTLGSQDYIQYAVASTSFFSIVNRLDRLMFCTKSLVGESFRVEGVSGFQNDSDTAEDAPLLQSGATTTDNTPIRPGTGRNISGLTVPV